MEKTKQITDRLQQQMDFVLAIDREKAIRRQTWLADDSRRETDAEHAWHLAMMVLVLSEYAEEAIDVTRTMAMVLCHDLVEIDAGDTYAYDEAAKRTQAARERAAADRLFAMLPPDQGIQLRGLWEEFEAGETPEAKFAHTLDCLQPTLLQTNGPSGLIGVKDYCIDLKGAKILDELTNDALKLQEDGVVYGVDYVEEDYGIIYNKKLLEKAGYKGDDIKDFASLKKVVEDIQARKAELGVKGAFTSAGLDSSSDWRFTTHLANLPLYYEFKDTGKPEAKEIKGTYLPNYKQIFDH